MKTILIADDEKSIRELLIVTLSEAGYRVLAAEDGERASELLSHQEIDLAVIDIMMPGKDGYELVEEIRRYFDFPVILLTAKDQLADKEKGFSSGTDDYLTKPFEPRELLFRIQALFRRYNVASAERIRLGKTVIDRLNYEVRTGNQTLMLPMKEFELLYQLASYPGRVFTREELISIVWGHDYEGADRTVDVHIKRLRERFKEKADFKIITVRGAGYRLEGITV